MASSYGSDADKGSLRVLYLNQRNAVPEKLRAPQDERILARLESLDVFKEATMLLCYVSHGSEIDTRPLMERWLSKGGRLAVPRVVKDEHNLEFCEISSLDELVSGTFGIMEPADDVEPVGNYEMAGSVCLVPGLVFDGDGQRIGYGGGYYDSFLPLYPGTKIGLARTWQLSNNPLPSSIHDVTVDVVVSETATWWCNDDLLLDAYIPR